MNIANQMKEMPELKKGPCYHNAPLYEVVGGKMTEIIQRREDVSILHIDGIWAMVRRKGCIPYVCHIKELEPRNQL